MSDEQKKPDALLIPRSMAGGGDYRAILARLAAIARPLFGIGPADPISVPWGSGGPDYFVYKGPANPAESYQFAKDHGRAGEDRHDWTRLEDGIQVGHLKPDPPPAA